jgi:prefoldin beta subunit
MTNSNESLQEIQLLEQNLHNISMQKSAFQIELSEIESALSEVNKSNEEVFKVIGQIMLKTQKSVIIQELSDKKKFLEIRIKSFENSEKSLLEKTNLLRDNLMKSNKEKVNNI